MQPTDVLDPAATAAQSDDHEDNLEELETLPEPRQPEHPDAGEPLDEYGPPAYALELVFESTADLADAQAVWRKAAELIESAKSKGLKLTAGQVYQATQEPEVSEDQIARAIAELDAIQQAAD